MKQIKLLSLMLAISASMYCQRVDPYQGSRIFWDMSSETTIFQLGNYARMIELQDGRLLAVAEGLGGTAIAFSPDKGSTWYDPRRIAAPPDQVFYANSEIIQLQDGTLLVGINVRPRAPYSEDRLFGIRVLRSTDNGETWSEPIFVYDAQHNFDDGCWEPAFLELPSGEIHCYFANENDFTHNHDQDISVSRSFDGGLTWSEPVTVCYRQGYRDGMPVPLLLQDESEIVVIIEDNGWPGRGNFAATTVRTTLEDNWEGEYVDANSPLRQMIFQTTPPTTIYSAAPYIRQLPWGETVASYQSNENRTSNDLQYADMYVLVGDDRAQNFKAKSAPFALGHDKHAIWNSVSVIDTGIVVAVGSIGPPHGANSVIMIKGYPLRRAVADYGIITVDGVRTPEEIWTTQNVSQLPMGQVTKNRTSIDFLYDNQYLYLTARVIDRNIINTGSDNDGVRFFIDVDDVSGTTPQEGMYSFFFDTNGTISRFQRGENGTWITDNNTSSILYAINVQSVYYNIEAAIPWSLLGKSAPPMEQRMAIAVEIANRSQYSLITERIPEVNNNASWTWLEFRLLYSENVGIKETSSSQNQDIKVHVNNNILHINSPHKIKKLSLYSYDGKLIYKSKKVSQDFQIPLPMQGGGILNISLEDGKTVQKKILR